MKLIALVVLAFLVAGCSTQPYVQEPEKEELEAQEEQYPLLTKYPSNGCGTMNAHMRRRQ